MRTSDQTQNDLFCAKTLEQLVPTNHRLRHLRPLVDEALRQLQPQFRKLYSHTGRPGIAPERLLRALLLQVLYGVRSERRLMEELACHMAWRWFVGLSLNEEVWDVTVFTKNRERFLQGDLAQRWLVAVVEMLRQRRLIDEEHFQRGRYLNWCQCRRAELSAQGESARCWSGQRRARRSAQARHA